MMSMCSSNAFTYLIKTLIKTDKNQHEQVNNRYEIFNLQLATVSLLMIGIIVSCLFFTVGYALFFVTLLVLCSILMIFVGNKHDLSINKM